MRLPWARPPSRTPNPERGAGLGSVMALAASLTPLVARLRIQFLPGMYGKALMP